MSSFRFATTGCVALAGLVSLELGGCTPSEGIHQVRVPAEISERRDQPAKPTANIGQPVAPAGPRYKLPEGWTVQPNAPMRAISLAVLDGDQKCDISLIRLGPDQSLLDNVNRWRGQVKLEPMDEATLTGQVKAVKCGPHEGTMVELAGAVDTILGVVIERPEATWFVKLQGPNAFALRETARFIAFTESIELP